MPSHLQCAQHIVRTLQAAGHEAYFAGGYVRDMILQRRCKDIDIATSAQPDLVQQLIPRTRAIGKAFGVIQASMDKYSFEIATFRLDQDYRDGRHPSSVRFTDARGDARRRDFTINALFYDPIAEAYLDFCDGLTDLANKVVRAVGNPRKRFSEDHLRMMRAVRFTTSLGFTLEESTASAIASTASKIRLISVERIREEFLRTLTEAQNPGSALILLNKLGLLKHILPLTHKSLSDADIASCARLLNRITTKTEPVILAAILARTGVSAGKRVRQQDTPCILASATEELKRLRSSRETIREVTSALRLFLRIRLSRKLIPRECLAELAAPQAAIALDLLFAAQSRKALRMQELRVLVKRRMAKPTVNGSDLKQLGFDEGPQMKEVLSEARILQAEGLTKREIVKRIRQS